jgi:hypothetical protein
LMKSQKIKDVLMCKARLQEESIPHILLFFSTTLHMLR